MHARPEAGQVPCWVGNLQKREAKTTLSTFQVRRENACAKSQAQHKEPQWGLECGPWWQVDTFSCKKKKILEIQPNAPWKESYDRPAAAAKSLQSCPTPCDPIDGNPPGSPVPGILQATTLEWVAISFSNASKWKVKVKSLSYIRLLVTPWMAACQAPPSIGFSRQEYWSGVPLPSPIYGHRKPFSLQVSSLLSNPYRVVIFMGFHILAYDI